MTHGLSRVLAVVVAALGLSVAAVAVPMSASAATPLLCETNGSFCVGSAAISANTAIQERIPGRDITLAPQGTEFGQDFMAFKLQFSSNRNLCVAAADNLTDVVIRSCTADGTVWGEDLVRNTNGTTSVYWVNKVASPQGQGTHVLSGRDSGTNFQILPLLRAGAFQKFDLLPGE
jgi:hypothetical protein